MGTTAQKLEYLGTTKSQLKDMINYGLPTENQITNETTFRNYVKGIFEAFIESLRDSTTLYTNLPKISGNGTQITLNDTANAPMRITLKASELSQDATPTPSSPQDIHTISGNNSVVVEGKNLCYKIEKQNNANMRFYFTNKSIQKYINVSFIINESLTNNSLYLVVDGESYGIAGQITGSANTRVNANITFSDTKLEIIKNGTTCYLQLFKSGATFNLPTQAQIENGTSMTSYTPYVSQTSPINLPVENLFDKNNANIINGYFTPSSPTITIDNNHRIIYIPIKPNTTYTIQKSNAGGSNSRFGIGTTTTIPASGVTVNQVERDNTATSQTITTNANAQYLVVWCYFTSNTKITESELYATIQIEYGSKANSFTPYGTTPIEYCKIGNYEDEFIYNTTDTNLELNKWYLKKNIGKVVLDGTESWVKDTTKEITQVFQKSLQLSDKNTNENNYYSNYFYNQPGDAEKIAFGATGNQLLYLAINKTIASSVDELKTWLSTHNTEVYYILASPTYTKITGELANQLEQVYKNMLSYKGTTNISQVNNDLPFVLGVSAIQDLE